MSIKEGRKRGSRIREQKKKNRKKKTHKMIDFISLPVSILYLNGSKYSNYEAKIISLARQLNAICS